MVSKEQLKNLIKDIIAATGKTQQEVAKGANYEPKTLTQILSSKADKKPAYDRLKMAYKEELKNSTLKAEVKLEQPQKKAGEEEIYKQKYIALLESQIKEKDKQLNFSLHGIGIGVSSTLIRMEVLLDQNALRDSGGDKIKAKQKRKETDKHISEKAQELQNKGTVVLDGN